MKNLIKFTIASLLLTAPLYTLAYSNSDTNGVCYYFSNGQFKNKQSCIISTGGGAGGYYTILQVGNKKYNFETSFMSGEHITYYKDEKITSYLRDGNFYNEISEKEADLAQHLLYCYRTKDKKLDICHN